MSSLPDGNSPSAALSLYEKLTASSPAERSELILQLIQASPQGRLELPLYNEQQAILKEVRLGRAELQDRLDRDHEPPAWWSPEKQGINLKGADLRGAHLGQADLQHADLRDADLSGAILRGADLRGAAFEGANMRGADLAGADLRGAALGGTDCRMTLLEEVNLQDASLRYADFSGAILEMANLEGADLWGAVFEGAVLNGANFQGATLKETDLREADLTQVNLQGTLLEQTDFSGSCLRGVDFRLVSLGSVTLQQAILTDAYLQDVDLSRCNLTGIHLGRSRLERTRLRQEQIGEALGEELTGKYEEARLGYLALERNFVELGDPDAASWAYLRRRRIEKRQAWKHAKTAWSQRKWQEAIGWFVKYASDQVVERLCNYGESISHVLLTMVSFFFLLTLIYGLTGGVLRVTQTPSGPVATPSRSVLDWVNFSMYAMSTSGRHPVDLMPSNEWIQLLTGLQRLIGIALASLVGFVFGHKSRR